MQTAIGSRLKARRRELRIARAKIAKAVGKSEDLVAAWESGRVRLDNNLPAVEIVAKMLQVDAKWLLTGENASLVRSSESPLFGKRYRPTDLVTLPVIVGAYGSNTDVECYFDTSDVGEEMAIPSTYAASQNWEPAPTWELITQGVLVICGVTWGLISTADRIEKSDELAQSKQSP